MFKVYLVALVSLASSVLITAPLSLSSDAQAQSINKRELRQRLRKIGYRRIRFDGPGSRTASACFNIREFELVLNRRGRTVGRTVSGWCDRRRDKDVEIILPARIGAKALASDQRLSPMQCQRFVSGLLYQQPINFETDSAALDRTSRQTLRAVSRVLNRCRRTTIRVEGHASATGEAERNLELSQARARAVAEFLLDKGVRGRKVQALGFGERHPLFSNDSAEGRERNKRVELVLEWVRR